jgi:hypothetical protein
MAIAWNLSGFAFIWLWENQWIKFKLSFSKISTTSALDLMHSYLSERKQCVKVGVDFSTWKNIYKGVPQVLIRAPVLFNIFLNDIYYSST